MIPAEFQTGNLLHLAILCTVAVGAASVAIVGSRLAGRPGQRILRLFLGWGCLSVWLMNTAYWMIPARFVPDDSLPLHFCNMANVFGALALLRDSRLFRGVIFFWSGLYLWAFLTPTVSANPAEVGFLIFWTYHGFIILSLAYILCCEGFRPGFRDLVQTSLFTLGYVFLLAILNAIMDWNYGFLGNQVPSSPTPVDLLGPYPVRILWMIMAGAIVFTLLWLPFRNHSTIRTRKK